jgi:ATP-dependent DNA helicase RecG
VVAFPANLWGSRKHRFSLSLEPVYSGLLAAVLFAHKDFSAMSKADRIRACYQHCCLMYVSNQRMSNQSLRKRFGFEGDESKAATVSQVIGSTKDIGLIKADESETSSTRYARYLPFWA